ncbi:MAG: heavy metal translocating P-type ATPase [Pseudomonadota bacterium]
MNSALPEELKLTCYHCGETVPPGLDLSVEIGGEARPMCCPGCRTVATMIAGSGLTQCYEQRSEFNFRPSPDNALEFERFTVYDDPALRDEFTTAVLPDRRESGDDAQLLDVRLLVGGISCAACVWLIETAAQDIGGVKSAAVNMSQQRLDVRIDLREVGVSEIFAHVAALGYEVQPWHANAQQQLAKAEYRRDLRRLAVAGIGMMQVGMFAIALHAGDIQGISDEYQLLLRSVSLLVSGFVLAFSARGFFESAWRHLRRGTLVMDLPVALALSLAFGASVIATVTGAGAVYFDSVIMFTFLLLGARFAEKRFRYRDALAFWDAEQTLPDSVMVWRERSWRRIPRRELEAGDRLRILSGEVVPIDGRVLAGVSDVREDSFSGEAMPRAVAEGDTVFASTVNLEGILEIEATGSYSECRLAALQRSVEHAGYEKPAAAVLADRVASYFVGAVLAVTGITAVIWYQIAPQDAFWVALSVLVISCPCALSLATPAALSNAAALLRRRGVLVHGENSLETLARCTHAVFDKTGTLTAGDFSLVQVIRLSSDYDEARLVAIATALQSHSNHPLATAFFAQEPESGVCGVRYSVGSGIVGLLNGKELRLGSSDFVKESAPTLPAAPSQPLHWIALSINSEPLAWFGLADKLRASAEPAIRALKQQGMKVELLSGDSSDRAKELALRLPFDQAKLGCSPEQKRAYVGELQARGDTVLMIGDGLNDAPVLRQANTSIVVSGATHLAQAQADFVLSEGDLLQIVLLRRHAHRTRSIVRQNFAWALAYNLLGIPFAALGWVAPWAAAVGMSASSLIVVANAARLRRFSRTAD